LSHLHLLLVRRRRQQEQKEMRLEEGKSKKRNKREIKERKGERRDVVERSNLLIFSLLSDHCRSLFDICLCESEPAFVSLCVGVCGCHRAASAFGCRSSGNCKRRGERESSRLILFLVLSFFCFLSFFLFLSSFVLSSHFFRFPFLSTSWETFRDRPRLSV
jgi:hypothetical protein